MADAKKLVSLKRTETDKRQDMGRASPIEAMAPDYPWGTCIHLDYDELEKLGIKKLPEVDTVLTLTARVVVTRRSESSASPAYNMGGEDESKSIDLQITDAKLE